MKTNYFHKRVIPVLFSILLFSGCRAEAPVTTAEKGVLDLSRPGSLTGSFVELQGEWGFTWDEFIGNSDPSVYSAAAASEYMDIPSYWSPYEKGAAIYSLRILLPPDKPDQLAIKLTNVLENYSLYADGKLLYTAGVPASSPEKSVADSVAALIPVQASGETLDIVIQVSNWKDLSGGLSRKIFFGEFQSIRSLRERFMVLDGLSLGAILIIAIYHLAAYMLTRFSKHDPSYLFLGIAFLMIALFIGSKDELLFKTLVPGFTAAIRSRFLYSALIISVPLFFCYIYFVFRKLFPDYIFKIVLIVSCAVWAVVIFTDRGIYTQLLIPMEIFNFIVSCYVVSKLFRYFYREKNFVIVAYLSGYLMLVCGVAFGILDNNLIVPPWSPEIVFLVFTLFQTILQAHNTAKYIKDINHLNNAFIEMEKETEKLYDLSNIDPLTSIANRRFLNEYMQKLWERNTITSTQIGMIVIDIDYFKLYNDRYGHLTGDECLEKVSTRFQELVNRKGDLVARYGGEEFVAVFQSCPLNELCRIAERMRNGIEALEMEHLDSNCSEFLTISAGAASTVPEKGTSWLSLFKLADEQLYKAKELGRNRVEPSVYLDN